MLTITARLTLWYLTIFGGIITALALALYVIFITEESNILDRECRAYAEFLIASANPKNLDMDDIYDRLQEVTDQADARFPLQRFFLINRDSAMFEHTPEALIDPFLDSLQLDMRSSVGRFQTVRVGNIEYRAYIHPVPNLRSDDLALVIVAPTHRLKSRAARLRLLLFTTLPLALVAAGIGGWFMARKALAPVAEITTAAATISATNLHRRVPIGKSQDELARLAATFNAMIDRLETTFQSQQQFITDASHDLRTPLTVIHAELQLLRRQHSDLETCSIVERGIREVEKLSRLAGDLLLLAKADAHQLVTTMQLDRLDEILVESVRRCRPLIDEKNISIQITIDEPVELLCDAAALERALVNLLGNAIKYTPQGGQVTVTTSTTEAHATCTISDNGPGIPEEELSKLFDRFYRSDRARNSEGSGLGLSIVKSIVEAHGGTITLESTLGTGTRASVVLPIG